MTPEALAVAISLYALACNLADFLAEYPPRLDFGSVARARHDALLSEARRILADANRRLAQANQALALAEDEIALVTAERNALRTKEAPAP